MNSLKKIQIPTHITNLQELWLKIETSKINTQRYLYLKGETLSNHLVAMSMQGVP